jgi:hypothetical protein
VSTGFVYLVQAGEDYRFKIGRTVNLTRRMRDLQLGSPNPLYLVGWFHTPDCYTDEIDWHQRMGTTRRHGEWFDLSLDQLRMFQARADIFQRLPEQRVSCLMDSLTPCYLSPDRGHVVEVTLEDMDREDPSVWYVEATKVESGRALLYKPHTAVVTYPDTYFEVRGEELSKDPRGAILCPREPDSGFCIPPWVLTLHQQANLGMADARKVSR